MRLKENFKFMSKKISNRLSGYITQREEKEPNLHVSINELASAISGILLQQYALHILSNE